MVSSRSVQLTAQNRERGASGKPEDSEIRDQMARVAYEVSFRAALSMTRDNRLWERDDVLQQVWVFAFEAVTIDKGIGDARAFYRFHILNRIRDWMGSTVRRHAFCQCTKCGHRQAIQSVSERECKRCGAKGAEIESVTIVDTKADWTDQRATADDRTAFMVEEFMRKLEPVQQAVLVDRINGRERVEISVRQGIPMSQVSKVVTSIQKAYIEQYA